MQVFLTLAFIVEAFLMTAHKKHEALDATVHGLLALTMWACALCTLGELFAPHSVLATAGRSLSCLMQGMWLIQVCFPSGFHNGHTLGRCMVVQGCSSQSQAVKLWQGEPFSGRKFFGSTPTSAVNGLGQLIFLLPPTSASDKGTKGSA